MNNQQPIEHEMEAHQGGNSIFRKRVPRHNYERIDKI